MSKKTIFAWCLYDWAYSAFSTILTTFIFATYFTQKIAIDPISGTHQWGYAIAFAGIIIAFLAPILGAIADFSGHCKYWLFIFSLMMNIGCSLLWFAYPHHEFIHFTLTCVVIATIGFELGFVFYNSLLPHLVPYSYLGRISGWAWGMGYAGGLSALIIALFGLVKAEPRWLDATTYEHIRICGPFISLWFYMFSWPFFLFVPDSSSHHLPLRQAIKKGLLQLLNTFKRLRQEKNIFLFLIANMIYMDGLNTIFTFGGIYAAGTFGLTLVQVMEFGIASNIVAGIGAALFAWHDDKFGSKRTIQISLVALILLATSILFIHEKLWFWILGLSLCIFVGPVQAASRSMMARIAPEKKLVELFGFFALSGKVTAFTGPWFLATLTYLFHSQRAGMSIVVLFFITGWLLLFKTRHH